MDVQLQIKMNEKLFLRDPEQSELGKKILSQSVILIQHFGFESFTFKKLALEIGTTEATIYRYFENKHRLLVYLMAWYWRWLEFRVSYHTNNVKDPIYKLKQIIHLLIIIDKDDFYSDLLDVRLLHEIMINEGTKTYLTKHVTEDNSAQLFKPYKDLCSVIGQVLLECNENYKYPRSLSSTMIEVAHFQSYFKKNLPSLTDFQTDDNANLIVAFVVDMVLSSLQKEL
jgi:AcrR family transcriptional regulator